MHVEMSDIDPNSAEYRRRFKSKCVGCCGGPDGPDKGGPVKLPDEAKKVIFQDQGPTCCKGDNAPANEAGGQCDLNDGEPVGANSGNFLDSREDLTIPGKIPFGVTAFYNSENPYLGHLGYGWSSIMSVRLFHWADSTWSLRDPYGRREDFLANGAPKSQRFYLDSLRFSGNTATLRVDPNQTWVFDRRDGTLQEVFNDAGRGYVLTYDASTASNTQAHPVTGRLQYPIKGISDYAVPRGMRSIIAMDYRVATLSDKTFPANKVTLAYDSSGQVATATDHSGRVVRYGYDLAGNLIRVVGVDSTYQRYKYQDPRGIHWVTSFDPVSLSGSDSLDTAISYKNQYDNLGRVTRQSIGYAMASRASQTYAFERNPYSISCPNDGGSHSVGDTWNRVCSYVRTTSVSRSDANGLGQTIVSTRVYVDTVRNTQRVTKASSGAVEETAPATFADRWVTMTETVGGISVVFKLQFDEYNRVVKVVRPDGTVMNVAGPQPGIFFVGEQSTGTSQIPSAERGRWASHRWNYHTASKVLPDTWYEETAMGGSPANFRKTELWELKSDLSDPFSMFQRVGTKIRYGQDSSIVRNTFDALGRVDSIFGFSGYTGRNWYASADAMLPDSVTYADGSGVRIARDALGRVVSVKDPLGRATLVQYEPKGQLRLRCAADSLCDRYVWKNGAMVKSFHGERRLSDGTFTPPLVSLEYTVNAQKRRTHTWRVTPVGKVLVEKRQLDNWGNVHKTWVNADTSNLDSTRWEVVQSATYDGRLRKTSESVVGTNGRMQTTNFTYDVLGNPTGRQDARGFWQRLKVDPYGNLVERRDTLGRVWRDSVNERGLPLMEMDPLGRKVYHTWNHLGQETRRIGWNKDTTLWIWKHDRLLKHRTPEGRWTTFGYDTMGRLLRAVAKVGDSALAPDANDLVTSWTYDKAGFRVSETVAGRKTHGWLVDGAGKLLADTNALGQVTRTVYDNLGRPVATISPFGDTLTLAYDARGVLSMGRIGRDTLLQTRSDNLGRPVWLRRPGEGTATSSFTASGFLQTVQDSLGRSFGFRQDAFGLDSTVTQLSVGTPRQAQRDAVGRLVKLVDEKNQATLFAWDSLDRLKSVTSPSGLVTNYAYVDSSNGWTRRTTTRVAGGVVKAESHLWDRDGLLRVFVDGKGTRALYSYDSLARMTGIVYKNASGTTAGSAKVFRYTAEGWTRATVFGSASDSLTYDALGRTLKSIQKIGSYAYVVEHRYDDKNRLDSLIHPDGSILVRRFDVRGRMVSLRRNGVRLDTLVWQGARRAGATLGNGITATYGYDAIGRLTSLKYAKGANTLLGSTFTYTTAGKLESQSRSHASSWTESYGWTTDGQLANANRGGYAYQAWSAEASGNAASLTTSGAAESRTYNGFGELTGVGSSILVYDLSGNLTSDGARSLFWTPDGRLDSVGGKQKFIYDALGRLVRRTLAGGESVNIVYDGWREIQSSSSTGEKVIRVWGEYLDEEVVEFRTKSGVTTTRYLLAGNNWNTEAQTDESGNITRTYLVDPFGTFKVYTGAGTDGKWFTSDDIAGDPATLEGERVLQGLPWYGSVGLYHLRNRWYSPTLQRFLSMDPLGFDAGDANLYRFEGNDPLGNLDPMGANVWTPEFRDEVIWTGVTAFATGVAIGAALTVASPAIVTVAAIAGAAMLLKSAIDVGAKGYQAYTGKDMLGRPLCPNQIEQLEREMILEGVGFAAGMLGGGLSGRMGGGPRAGGVNKGLTENSGRAGNKGSAVSTAEATSGNTPRGSMSNPGVGNSSKPSVGPRCTGGACTEGACFPAGTPVSTDSAHRSIEEIKAGDTVLAMDPSSRALTRSRVAQTFVRLVTSFVMVFAGGDSITATTEHPFWTSQSGWMEAKSLQPGDSLWMPTQGQLLAIDSVRSYETAPTKVFNFEVEGVHNYLVGTLGIAVHNSCTQPGAGGSGNGNSIGRYENPGHHDPRMRGQNGYDRTRSVLPENHKSLWEKSVPDPEKADTRWAKEGFGKKAEYHRFQNDGNGNWHWNGSTNGKTLSGQPRAIEINLVPESLKRNWP